MALSQAQSICKNYETLKSARVNLDNIVQDIIDYIAPFYTDVTRTRAPGDRRTYKIFDSTATYGSFILSQFIQGAVCNSATRWFGLGHSDPAINEDSDAANCLKDWTTAMLLAFRRSNFYQGNGQAINSWINMGTGPLLCEMVPKTRDGLNQLRFTAIPFGKYVMAEGPDGKVDTFIWEVSMKLINAAKMFAKDGGMNFGLSDDLMRNLDKTPYKDVTFLHCICPRENMEYGSSKVKRADQLPWASCWVEKEKLRMVRESGYRLFPVAISRYDLIAGEPYGRGPSEMALPDARTMNEADKKEMLMWDRQLDPPTLSKRNSIINGVLNKRAGGDTVVTDPNNSVRQLFDQPNWQADDLMRKRKVEQILRIYHVSEILNLLSREKPELTAFETNARLNLLQQIQGPVYSRLEQDYQSVLINVTLDNMAHAGMLKDPPDILRQGATDGVLSVSYESPLARAARNQEITDLQQSVADIGGIQQFDPTVLQMVDFKKVGRKLFEIRGTQDMLLPLKEFQDKLNQLAAQQNAEKAAQLGAGVAQAAGQAAPFLKVMRDQAGGAGSAAA
jgi:hypothetical protein